MVNRPERFFAQLPVVRQINNRRIVFLQTISLRYSRDTNDLDAAPKTNRAAKGGDFRKTGGGNRLPLCRRGRVTSPTRRVVVRRRVIGEFRSVVRFKESGKNRRHVRQLTEQESNFPVSRFALFFKRKILNERIEQMTERAAFGERGFLNFCGKFEKAPNLLPRRFGQEFVPD